MACQISLSLNTVQTGDMALDQAIYEPTQQKIYGVRGQWLFRFSPVTGSLEASLRFATDVAGTSTITSIAGKLYIGTEFTPSNNLNAVTPFPDRDIYVVDAASFTVSGRLNLGAKPTYSFNHLGDYLSSGWHFFVNSGGNILGLVDQGSLFTVDPTNVPGYSDTAFGIATDIYADDVNGVLWISDQSAPRLYCVKTNPLNASSCFDTNGNLNTITGVTYNQAQNKVYAVDGTFNLLGFAASLAVPAFANFHVSSFNTGRINANPQRIKSVNNQVGNPHNGKVLIPTWSDDAVVIWNPLTDTVDSVLTGFTSPFDVVVCPTTNWAVCSGTVGLQQIT